MNDDDLIEDEIESPRIERSRVMLDYATHSVPISVVEERCGARTCRRFAAHKVGDQSSPGNIHELTTCLCCTHMRAIGMNCDLYGGH